MKKEKFDFRTIHSFEDACKKEGIDPSLLPDVTMIPHEFRQAMIGGYKLFMIFKAINDGWIADFTNSNQYKYYPWLRINSAGSGFDGAVSGCDYVAAATCVGSHLCTDTRQKALYIGQTFAAEYATFFL